LKNKYVQTGETIPAFDMLLEAMEQEVQCLEDAGKEGFDRHDMEAVGEMMEAVKTVHALRGRVAQIREEWDEYFCEPEPESQSHSRRDLGRAGRGQRTHEREFRLPLLQVLIEMGGKGRTRDVVDAVGRKIEGRLNEVDCEPLKSNPDSVRWRNTVQWSRNTLAQQGLLRSTKDSGHGLWEIADKGREVAKEWENAEGLH
jgi:hypothetical protein